MAEALRTIADLGICPHGNGSDCEICLRERLEPGLKSREEWQVKGVGGEVKGFAPGIEVGLALRRSVERMGDTRGQDMILADGKTKLTGVFDGLGGVGDPGSGAEASAYAAELMPEVYDDVSRSLAVLAKQDKLKTKIEDLISAQYDGLTAEERRKEGWDAFKRRWESQPEAVRMESLRLFYAVKRLNERLGALLANSGGRTTLVVGKTVEAEGQRYEVIVNVGDSGAYRRRADGTVEQVTVEDSAVQRALEEGTITEADLSRPDIVGMLARRFGFRPNQVTTMMFEVMGGATVRPRVTAVPVAAGEAVIYATDGLDKGLETQGDPLARLDAKALAIAIDPSLGPAEAAAALRDEAMMQQVHKDDCGVIDKRYS